jgi:hypothetical protein
VAEIIIEDRDVPRATVLGGENHQVISFEAMEEAVAEALTRNLKKNKMAIVSVPSIEIEEIEKSKTPKVTRDVNANDLRELRSAPLTVEEKLELARQRMQEQIDGMTPGEFKSFRKMND